MEDNDRPILDMILGKYGKTRQYLEHVLVLGTQWGLYSYCIVLSSVLDLLRVRSWTVWDSVFDDAGGLMLSRPGNLGTCYRGMALVSWRLISQAVRLFVQWEVSTDHSWIHLHKGQQYGKCFHVMMPSCKRNYFRFEKVIWLVSIQGRRDSIHDTESNCDR